MVFSNSSFLGNIKNHRVNENEKLKRFQKNKLYKMVLFKFFEKCKQISFFLNFST